MMMMIIIFLLMSQIRGNKIWIQNYCRAGWAPLHPKKLSDGVEHPSPRQTTAVSISMSICNKETTRPLTHLWFRLLIVLHTIRK